MARKMETEAIWKEFHGRLLSHIRRRVPTIHDAEDILQEVFARIHANDARLIDAQSVTGWVYRIARNAIIDYYRARAKAAGALAQLEEAAAARRASATDRDGGPQPSTELAHCIRPLLEQLPEPHGQALTLTELGGTTQKEAAQQMGLSVSGMKSRVQRGRAQLRELLLDCCRVELDRRQGVVDYEQKDGRACGDCGCG